MSRADGKEKKPDGRKISRKLSPKRRQFVAKFTDPTSPTFGNATRSAIASGYGIRGARTEGSRLLANANVSAEIERILDEAGATREKAAKVINEALEATQTRVFCPGEGKLVYSEPFIDHQTRLKAAEMNHRLRGDFPTTHEQERRNLLAIQQNILIVPSLPAEPKELPPPVREIEE